jgi:hypothetical protein
VRGLKDKRCDARVGRCLVVVVWWKGCSAGMSRLKFNSPSFIVLLPLGFVCSSSSVSPP